MKLYEVTFEYKSRRDGIVRQDHTTVEAQNEADVRRIVGAYLHELWNARILHVSEIRN